MATAQKTKPLRLLNLVVGVPQEVQQLLPSKLKEIQSQEHPLLLETLQQMRDTEREIFNLDTIYSCVLAFLLLDRLHSQYSKELHDEVEAILSSVLEKEPQNLIALCVKQEFRKTKATKEKIKALADCPDTLNHAYAVLAFYLYKLDPRNITASTRLLEQAVKVWEDNGKGNEVKVIVWKQLLAEMYCDIWYRDMFSKNFDPEKIQVRVSELLQSGTALETEQDIPLRYLAARCYTVLALSLNLNSSNKYQLNQYEIETLEELGIAPMIEAYFDRASELCDGEDPYVMEKYGIYMRTTARTQESLEEAAEILEDVLEYHPHRHVAEFALGMTFKALWTIDENSLQRHIFLNNFDDWVNEYALIQSKFKDAVSEADDAFKKLFSLSSEVSSEEYAEVLAETYNSLVKWSELSPEVSDETTEDDIECSAGDPPLNVPNDDSSFGSVSGDTSLNVSCCDNPEGVGDASLNVSNCNNAEESVGDASLSVPSNDSSERDADASSVMPTCMSADGFVLRQTPKTWSDHMDPQSTKLAYDECCAMNPKAHLIQHFFIKSHFDIPLHSAFYLNLAIHHFTEANEKAKGRQAVYLIELARAHISCNDIDTALGYFENAERTTLCSTFGHTKHTNVAYLYEQWALLLLQQLKRHTSLQTQQKKIESSIKAKKKDIKKFEEKVQMQYPGNKVLQVLYKAFALKHHLKQLAVHASMILRLALKVLEDETQKHERRISEIIDCMLENQLETGKHQHQMQSNKEQNDMKYLESAQNHMENLYNTQNRALEVGEDLQTEYVHSCNKLENTVKKLVDMELVKQESYNSYCTAFIDLENEVQMKAQDKQLDDLLKQLEDFMSVFDAKHGEDQSKILEQFVEMNEVTTSEVSDADDVEAQMKKLSRIECYFLKSIRSAVKVKSKSRLAYHKLAEMLEDALQRDPSSPKWMVLCEIYQLVGESKKAQSLLENIDMATSKARRLLKQQCIQDEEYGKYLDLAHVIHNSKPDGSLRHDIVEMILRKMKVPPGQTPNVDVNEQFRAYGEAMKIFLNEGVENLPNKAQCHRGNDGDDTNVLVFMARCEDAGTGGFSYIAESLKQCGIQVGRYLKRSLDDFEMGCNTRVEIMKTIERCHLILASDFTDNRKMGDSLPPVSFIVEEASQCERRVPILILQETGDPVPEEWKALPRVDVRDVNTDAMFHDFITKVFQNICPRKCPHCKNTLHRLTETPVV